MFNCLFSSKEQVSKYGWSNNAVQRHCHDKLLTIRLDDLLYSRSDGNFVVEHSEEGVWPLVVFFTPPLTSGKA
jgi:hypothetical protein